jgi:tetratricopeptide (TPR) repeat protein
MPTGKKKTTPRNRAAEPPGPPKEPAPPVASDAQAHAAAAPTPTAARAVGVGVEGAGWSKRLGLLMQILGLAGAVVTAYFWLGARVDKAVTARIEPYEHLLLGMGAEHDEEYDRAVQEFEKAFDALSKRGDSQEQLVPVIDYYLYAIVNSRHPADYSNKFNKVKRLIDEHAVSPDAFCFHQLGWYYLRTGELENARPLFARAKDKYAEEQRQRASADTYWALALIDLADGKVDEAVGKAREAALKNPVKYDLKQMARDQGAMKIDPWYQVLMRLYPEIDKSWSTFFARLEAAKTP